MAIGTTLKISFDAKSVQRGLASMGSSLAGFGSKIAKIGIGTVTATTAAAAAGFVAFAKSSSDAAAEIESMSTAFEVLTGSADKAKGLLEEIRQFGATTPLEQKDLIKASQTLLAFGVKLEDVMPMLRMLGDVSMGSAEKLGSLALVFGQVSSAGKLTGQDLLQFVNVGFNPLNEIAKRTGKTMSELRDEMSKGKISTAMVRQALVDATGAGGLFNNMLNRMASTTEGKLSNMKDNFALIQQTFGKGFNDGLKAAVDAINLRLPQMLESFRQFGVQVGATISDAVAGNFDKLVAAGDLIGTIVAEAANKAFRKTFRGIGEKVLSGLDSAENFIRDNTGLSNVIGRSTLGARAADAGEVLDKNETRMMIKAIQMAAEKISNSGLVPGTNGKFRYAQPGESTPFRDANGARVVEVLNKIEHNTKAGAKM